jgi:hypothetical protein
MNKAGRKNATHCIVCRIVKDDKFNGRFCRKCYLKLRSFRRKNPLPKQSYCKVCNVEIQRNTPYGKFCRIHFNKNARDIKQHGTSDYTEIIYLPPAEPVAKEYSDGDCLAWIEKTIRKCCYVDFSGINELITVYDCIGTVNLDSYTPAKQIYYMWKACLEYYEKNKFPLLETNI